MSISGLRGKDVVRYYRYLFSFPKPAYMIASLAVLYTLIAILADYKTSLHVAALTATPCVISYIIALYLGGPLKRHHRVIGLALLMTTVSAPLAIVYSTAISSAIPSFYTGLTLLINIGFYGIKLGAIVSIPLVAGMMLLTYTIYGGIPLSVAITYIIGLLTFIALNAIRFYGRGLIDLGRLYVLYKLENVRDIEDLFRDMSVNESVVCHILLFDGGPRRIALVHPNIHYGPFAGIGSSDLPRIIESLARDKGFSVIMLHGMGSHERNIVASTDSMELANDIISRISSGKGVECLPMKPFILRESGWRAFVIPFTCMTLVILSRDNGIDDMPYSIQEYADAISAKYFIPPMILVDAHNHELSDDMDLDSVYRLIDHIASKLRSRTEVTRLKVGLGESMVKGVRGLVGGRVYTLVLEYDGITACIAYLPGNNMEPGLRDEIVNVLSNYCEISEAITNDEHSETGLFTGEAYNPIPRDERIVEAVRRSVKEALKITHYVTVKYIPLVKKLRLVGNRIWQLKMLLDKYFYKILFIIFLYLAISIFIGMVTSLIVV